jgi:ATP-dependent Clp protease protease subunit
MKRQLNEMLARHTGKSLAEVERDTDRDNFMSSSEALDYGLIDKVYTSRSEILA